MGILEPGCDPRAAGGLQWDDAGNPQLDRFLHHPGEALTVPRRDRERHLGRPSLPFSGPNLYHPLAARLYQEAGAAQPCAVQYLHTLAISGPAHPQMMHFVFI
jgi:hypothetical protein